MILEQLDRADITEQHRELLLPRHLLHLGQARSRARRLGQKSGPQRMRPHRTGIEPCQPRILLDDPRNRPVGHLQPGHRPNRGKTGEQGARRIAPSAKLTTGDGKSKGGWTTKILALTDALGNLVRFVLPPGNRFDTIGVAPLVDGIEFDANWIIEELGQRGAKVVISRRPKRLSPIAIDLEMYKWRHLIEHFFCKFKEFERIAMRACKTDRSFEALIYLCSAVINVR